MKEFTEELTMHDIISLSNYMYSELVAKETFIFSLWLTSVYMHRELKKEEIPKLCL